MPIHDWTRVDAGIFHHFHHGWNSDLCQALNRDLLPPDHYALVEQIADGAESVTFALQSPMTEMNQYAVKAKAIVVRYASDDRAVAVLKVLSPGIKETKQSLRAFVETAFTLMRSGVHLMVVDLFPPGPIDQQGIAKEILDEFKENNFELPTDKPLTLVSYLSGPRPEMFVEPVAVGGNLTDMPLFLAEKAISVPLEKTYQLAFEDVPSYSRKVLEK